MIHGFLQVAVLVSGECTNFDKGNGEVETTCNSFDSIITSKMVTNITLPSCFKVNVIVHYDNNFRDNPGPDTPDPITRFVFFTTGHF